MGSTGPRPWVGADLGRQGERELLAGGPDCGGSSAVSLQEVLCREGAEASLHGAPQERLCAVLARALFF